MAALLLAITLLERVLIRSARSREIGRARQVFVTGLVSAGVTRLPRPHPDGSVREIEN